MKNDDEMYQSVLQRRTEYREKRAQRMQCVRKTIPVAACFCLTVVLGVGLWNRSEKLPGLPAGQESGLEALTTEATFSAVSIADTNAAETAQTETEAAETVPAVLMTEAVEMPAETEPENLPQPTAQADTPTEMPAESRAQEPETELPAGSTSAETQAIEQTEPATEAVVEQELEGFLVLNYDGVRKIVCTDPFPEPDGTLREYTVEGDKVWLLDTWDETNDEGKPVRYYKIECMGEIFTVTQQEYQDFTLELPKGMGRVIQEQSQRAFGYYLKDQYYHVMYWFDDNEGFCVSGEAWDKMNRICNSFKPVDAAEQ